MYANDADDTFASQIWDLTGNQTFEFASLWQPYMKNWDILYDPFRTNECYPFSNTWGNGSKRCQGYGVTLGLLGYQGSSSGMFQVDRYDNSMYIHDGKSLTSFDKPAEMTMLGTTSDEPMYSLNYDWQYLNGAPHEFVPLKELRDSGRYVQAFVDGHAKTVMYGAFKSPSYSYLVMPKSRTDADRMCATPESPAGYYGKNCKETLDMLFDTRSAY